MNQAFQVTIYINFSLTLTSKLLPWLKYKQKERGIIFLCA